MTTTTTTHPGTTHPGTTHPGTTHPGTTRAGGLTREALVALHPHIVNIPDGQLALGDSMQPSTVEDFKTVDADVDAIFETHLPAFLTGRVRPVPLVIYAHGGLVGKASGLGVAHKQVGWWKENGAFPVQFVWETGMLESLWDAVKDAIPFAGRGFGDEARDFVVEKALRGVQGHATWGAMKRTAELASGPGGGARYFARRLGEFMRANPGAISVHAVGHSAGSIFHSHLVPQMLSAGVPAIASLNLLAPAIRVDEFTQRLLRKQTLDRIEALTMFTMSEHFEKQDTCMKVYKKSLLYLIRAALEKDEGAEILGLQESVLRNRQIRELFGAPGSGAKGEVMWSKTVGGGPRSSSFSISHGGFDDDAATMESLARRILDRDDLVRAFPKPTRALEPSDPWEAPVIEPLPVTEGPARRALCIGIDAYPGQYALSGCVADAHLWADEFTQADFEVELLLDQDATREEMVERIQHLVVSSRAGDVLAVQYSGHGTFVPDLDHDEAEEDGQGTLADEAVCPVDFEDGNLLIDDDLGQIWDQLPDGVSLTIFFDSCHSGGAQRNVIKVPTGVGAKARLVRLSRSTVEAFTRQRGPGAAVAATASADRERGVFFGACLPSEVAWESGGQGEFTRRAVPLLRASLGSTSNQGFFDSVLAAFGDDPQQTPVLRPPHLASRSLLASLAPARRPVEIPDLTTAPPSAGPLTKRDRAIATILRGVADLIES